MNQAAAGFKLMQKMPQSEDSVHLRIARLEEQVRRLQGSRPSTAGSCCTCTRPTHASGECPGKKVECFTCGLLGHFRGSAVCNGKKAAEKKKKKIEKSNRVQEVSDDNESDTESDSIGRVAEIVRAAGSDVKNKTTQLQMTVLDHGQAAKELQVEFLIDSGVYRTLLTEEQWKKVQADGSNRKPKLKINKAVSYTHLTLPTILLV